MPQHLTKWTKDQQGLSGHLDNTIKTINYNPAGANAT